MNITPRIRLMNLELQNSKFKIFSHWCPHTEDYFKELLTEIPWEEHEIRLFGKTHKQPRLLCYFGDPKAEYSYSRKKYLPKAWMPSLLELKYKIQDLTSLEFNSVLANLYRNGSDSMGWHSDSEKELGPRPQIASLSLGATRRFLVREKSQPKNRFEIELRHGDLLLMQDDFQYVYQHALPKTKRVHEPRINLTFRKILF